MADEGKVEFPMDFAAVEKQIDAQVESGKRVEQKLGQLEQIAVRASQRWQAQVGRAMQKAAAGALPGALRLSQGLPAAWTPEMQAAVEATSRGSAGLPRGGHEDLLRSGVAARDEERALANAKYARGQEGGQETLAGALGKFSVGLYSAATGLQVFLASVKAASEKNIESAKEAGAFQGDADVVSGRVAVALGLTGAQRGQIRGAIKASADPKALGGALGKLASAARSQEWLPGARQREEAVNLVQDFEAAGGDASWAASEILAGRPQLVRQELRRIQERVDVTAQAPGRDGRVYSPWVSEQRQKAQLSGQALAGRDPVTDRRARLVDDVLAASEKQGFLGAYRGAVADNDPTGLTKWWHRTILGWMLPSGTEGADVGEVGPMTMEGASTQGEVSPVRQPSIDLQRGGRGTNAAVDSLNRAAGNVERATAAQQDANRTRPNPRSGNESQR